MLEWLVPAAVSAVGGFLSNRSSARAARENRQFQERMSSTAVQRSKADFEAAGFHPMLATERPASTPGGSVAQVEDAVSKGVSSGLSARVMGEQLKLLREQTREASGRADVARAHGQVELAKAAPWSMHGSGTLRDVYAKAELARLHQELALQPFQLTQLQALSKLTGAQVPGAEAEAAVWKNLESMGPVYKALLPMLRLIKPR